MLFFVIVHVISTKFEMEFSACLFSHQLAIPFLHTRIPLWGHFLSSTKVCEHFLHSTQVKFLHCAHKFRTWRKETLNILLVCFVDWRKSIMLQDHNHIRIECKQMHMVCQSLFLLLLLFSEENKNPIHKNLIFYFKITYFTAKNKEKLKYENLIFSAACFFSTVIW